MPQSIDVPGVASVQEAAARAAAVLQDGGLVVMGTDTVYGVAAIASSASALDALWRVKGTPLAERAPLAWHLDSTASLERALWPEGGGSPLQRRLLQRVTPGPVTFVIAMDAPALTRLRAHAGDALPGAFDDGSSAILRVPARPLVQEVARQTRGAIVIVALGNARRMARDADDAAAILAPDAAAHIALWINDGPATVGKQSTLIRLEPSGAFRVEREGALEERYIRARLARTILFVCTGNTCRSPMAEAIARHLLRERPGDGVETRVLSAGTTAAFGAPASPEAGVALRAMGIELGQHRSTPLTREMLRDADLIFALTGGHAQAIRAMDPYSSDRVALLDPQGHDIEDPIGGPQSQYDRCAREVRNAVEQRLREVLEPPPKP